MHGQDTQDLSNFKQPIVSALCWLSFIAQNFILKNSKFHCLIIMELPNLFAQQYAPEMNQWQSL